MTKSLPSRTTVSPTLRITAASLILVFATIVVASMIFRVEVIAKGQGRVVPIGRVQAIQSEFGGRISEIKVSNYQEVEKDDVLLEFDNTEFVAKANIVRASIAKLEDELERIGALINVVSEINLDARSGEISSEHVAVNEFSTEKPASSALHDDLLSAEIGSLLSKVREYETRFEYLNSSVAVKSANIRRIDAAIEFWAERLQMTEEMYVKGAYSRSDLLNVQEQFVSLEAERSIVETELIVEESNESGLIAEIQSWLASTRSTLLNRKVSVENQLEELSQELTISKRRMDAAIVRSPISGMVTELITFTEGGVVQGGGEVMRIVPVEQPVEIETLFSNRDMGFLQTGQQSRIKLDAYPFERFGTLNGTVTEISADSIGTPTGVLAYKVRVLPEARGLEVNGELFSLRPGMTVEVDVITSDRTLISYFFAPIVKAVTDSLGEL